MINGWVRIYANGTDGWIYSTFLAGTSSGAQTATVARSPERVTTPANTPGPGKVVQIAAHVTLRDAPAGNPVYDLQPGERVKIAETNGKWVRVLTVSGDTGWVLTR